MILKMNKIALSIGKKSRFIFISWGNACTNSVSDMVYNLFFSRNKLDVHFKIIQVNSLSNKIIRIKLIF